jgi:hypothetical protein
MLDRRLLGVLRPALDAAARHLVARGVGADAVTLAGFAIGLAVPRRSRCSTRLGLALIAASAACATGWTAPWRG